MSQGVVREYEAQSMARRQGLLVQEQHRWQGREMQDPAQLGSRQTAGKLYTRSIQKSAPGGMQAAWERDDGVEEQL